MGAAAGAVTETVGNTVGKAEVIDEGKPEGALGRDVTGSTAEAAIDDKEGAVENVGMGAIRAGFVKVGGATD